MVSDSASQAVRQHSQRSNRGLIVVSGREAASKVSSPTTSRRSSLYAAYLTPGRMIVNLLVYELGDLILLAVPRAHTAA